MAQLESVVKDIEALMLEVIFYVVKGYDHIIIMPFKTGYKIQAQDNMRKKIKEATEDEDSSWD